MQRRRERELRRQRIEAGLPINLPSPAAGVAANQNPADEPCEASSMAVADAAEASNGTGVVDAIAELPPGDQPQPQPPDSLPPPDSPTRRVDHSLTGSPFITSSGHPIDLRNLYAGASIFILLPGPSLASLDLSKLNRRGIYTMGVNNSPCLFRPTAWTCVDRPEKFIDATWKDPGVLKFVNKTHLHKQLRERTKEGTIIRYHDDKGRPYQVRDMPGVIGTMRNGTFDADEWLREPSMNWGTSKKANKRTQRPRVLNVMFCVLKTAYALGFRRVYLLGCDFKMEHERPYAFGQKKPQGGVDNNNLTYRLLNEYFAILRPKYEQAGFVVLNCNPSSGLQVFDFIGYDAAIREATKHIEQNPDGSGWYEITEKPQAV